MLKCILPILLAGVAAPAAAQFDDEFDKSEIALDPSAHRGWAFLTGDGEATMRFSQGPSYGIMAVDATRDRRGIWWAIIKRSISPFVDQKALLRADRELRVEARVRTHTAPRRVNLSFNHTRTKDFHSNLAEYDLADTDWHVISFTTKGFDATPQDEIFVQVAMMDWGLRNYEVDVDYLKVSVVDPKKAGPDLGPPLPYRPDIPALASFREHVPVLQDATIDAAYPWVNFSAWQDMTAGEDAPLIATSGSQTMLLRWDLSAYRGRVPDGWGVLELTTEDVHWAPTDLEEFGYIRSAEILGGDPSWTRDKVTQESFFAGADRADIIGQMFEDTPPVVKRGGKTLIQVSPAVLERLISGRSKGIAISSQGALNAAFYSGRSSDPAVRPKLHFNLK